MTPIQRSIITWARSLGGYFTKREAVAQYGHRYYCNADFHVGNLLSTMVKRGILVREKPGHYRIGKKIQPPPTIPANQTDLFES